MPQAILRTSLCDKCDKSFFSPSPHAPVPTERLHLNYVPTEAELAGNLTLLADDERELARYAAEISRVREVLRQLEGKKALFEQRVLERRNLVSVKRKVPAEIWTEIFSHLCFGYNTKSAGSGEQEHHYSFRVDGKFPYFYLQTLALSHACAKWKDIVNNRPHLWSNISVDLHGIPEDDAQARRATRLLNLYLKRSGAHPLHITIMDSKGQHPFPPSLGWEDLYTFASYYIGYTGQRILSILMYEMHRCEDLTMSLSLEILAASNPEGDLEVSFPILRTFRNDIFRATDAAEGMDWFFDGIEGYTPKLVDMSILSSCMFHWMHCPYSQLTSLVIDWLSDIDILESLASSSCLVSLIVSHYVPDNDDTTDLTFPYMEHFSLDVGGSPDGCSKLLRSLSFPCLKSLTICGFMPHVTHDSEDDPYVDLDWSPLRGLIERSSSTLQKFTLHFPDVPLSYVDIILMLCECPRLEQLVVVVGEDGSTVRKCSRIIASGKCPPDELEPLLPRLRQVAIQETYIGKPCIGKPYGTPISKMVDSVVQMAESRAKGNSDVSRLESVLVRFSPPCLGVKDIEGPFLCLKSNVIDLIGNDPDLCERIRVLEQDGMRCAIRVDPE